MFLALSRIQLLSQPLLVRVRLALSTLNPVHTAHVLLNAQVVHLPRHSGYINDSIRLITDAATESNAHKPWNYKGRNLTTTQCRIIRLDTFKQKASLSSPLHNKLKRRVASHSSLINLLATHIIATGPYLYGSEQQEAEAVQWGLLEPSILTVRSGSALRCILRCTLDRSQLLCRYALRLVIPAVRYSCFWFWDPRSFWSGWYTKARSIQPKRCAECHISRGPWGWAPPGTPLALAEAPPAALSQLQRSYSATQVQGSAGTEQCRCSATQAPHLGQQIGCGAHHSKATEQWGSSEAALEPQ